MKSTQDRRGGQPEGMTYRSAGVDIDAGERLVERIKPWAKKTMRPEVLSDIGGFGAVVEIASKYKRPVLVSGTDGVGTKLKLAFAFDKHDTVGIDLVAMSVNDVAVQGAEPLFFLDYFACGKLDVDRAEQVVKGVAKGCELSGCALIGGETAEMPGMYPEGEYDLAGFAVGVAEKDEIVDGRRVAEGDAIIGLPSSGLHSNGYSLARKILAQAAPDLDAPFDEGKSLKEVLLEPTRLYPKAALAALAAADVKGMAHITGGGLLENIPRSVPDGLRATLRQDGWQVPKIFQWLREQGGVAESEMARSFNCGVGYVFIATPQEAAAASAALKAMGERPVLIGRIEKMTDDRRVAIVPDADSIETDSDWRDLAKGFATF